MTVPIAILLWVLAAPAAVWLAGAIYYDLCRQRPLGRLLAALWLIAVLLSVFLPIPVWIAPVVTLCVVAGSLGWWLRIEPRSDRDWRPDLALPATPTIEPDAVTIHNLRHSLYRSLDDVTPRYRDVRLQLDGLRAMDLVVGNWGSALMAHPFAVFEFAPGPDDPEPVRVGFSLEVRNRIGEGFSLFRNLYRQNELFCAAADERDLIRRRVEHEPSTSVHLYRLRLRPETVRIRFLDYARLLNDLAERPRWYNGITTNCTTGVYKTFTENRPPLDWRVVANGKLDAFLYDLGLLDDAMPFEELKAASLINETARGLPDEGFGDAIRRGRPGFGTM